VLGSDIVQLLKLVVAELLRPAMSNPNSLLSQ